MSNFLLQLEADNVDLIPSSLLSKKRISGAIMAPSGSVPFPRNLLAVDSRTSILYVASYPTNQETDASSPNAENIARIYAYPYAGIYAERRRPVEINPSKYTDKRHFIPKNLVLSPEGDFLAVVGTRTVEIIKLHSIIRKLSLCGISHKKDGKSEYQQVLTERDRADSFGVETMLADSFFIEVPSNTSIVHVTWHPLSFTHVVVLTSNNVITMYNLLTKNDGIDPEQRFVLPQTGAKAVHLAFACDTAGSLVGKGPTLEERFLGWNVFTCFVLYENGSVDALCPVIPYDVYISKRIKEDISYCSFVDECDSSANKEDVAKFMCFAESTFNSVIDNSEADDVFFKVKKESASSLEVIPINILPPIKLEKSVDVVLASKLIYYLGSPSVLVRVTSRGVLDVNMLCSDMYPNWKSAVSVGSTPVVRAGTVIKNVSLSPKVPVTIDSSESCMVCRASGAQIFITAKHDNGYEDLLDINLSRPLRYLSRRFESDESGPLMDRYLSVEVKKVVLGTDVSRIFGLGFHGSSAMLVLSQDGRLKVVTNERFNMGDLCEKSSTVGPLKIELNDTTNPEYALLCERLFGKSYLDKITEIMEFVVETKQR